MTPRSFDAWVEAEMDRLNEEADAWLDIANKWRRAEMTAGILPIVAVVAVMVSHDWMAYVFAAIGLFGVVMGTMSEIRGRRALRRSWLAAGHRRGLVEAATHPSRSSTLIARAPFDVKREEASN